MVSVGVLPIEALKLQNSKRNNLNLVSKMATTYISNKSYRKSEFWNSCKNCLLKFYNQCTQVVNEEDHCVSKLFI